MVCGKFIEKDAIPVIDNKNKEGVICEECNVD
jgi:hypothetical protein